MDADFGVWWWCRSPTTTWVPTEGCWINNGLLDEYQPGGPADSVLMKSRSV